MNKFVSIDEAFNDNKEITKNLLLGNGFSISIEQKFNYSNLLDVAVEKLPFEKKLSVTLQELFSHLKTVDFEKVLNYLNIANKINNIYQNKEITESIENDMGIIRQAFVDGFIYTHPRNILSISENHINFISKFDQIFTTNYDLLLYWIIMDNFKSYKNDGFGYPPVPVEPHLSHPIWLNELKQNTFYLHGSFHLYSSNYTYKEVATNYENEYMPLLQKIKNKIDNNEYPLIVFEGSSAEKLLTINSNPYLEYSYSMLGKIKGCLFIFGSSLNLYSDKHIVDKIKLSNVEKIYIGYHNDHEKFDKPIYELKKSTQKKIYLFDCLEYF